MSIHFLLPAVAAYTQQSWAQINITPDMYNGYRIEDKKKGEMTSLTYYQPLYGKCLVGHTSHNEEMGIHI